jgi:HEAT repeat protein
MLDATAKKLLRLLRPDSAPELRRAAALVLGEVGTRSSELTAALGEALADSDSLVRLEALHAVGKLRIESALPRLVERIAEGGPESEAAALAAARLGDKGTRALKDLMGHVAPGLRRRIAAALASAGTASAETAAVDALLDSDPGVVDAAARSLGAEIPSLTPASRKALADHLLDLLKKKKGPPLPPASETAIVRLVAALGDERAKATLWERTAPGYRPEVRGAALQALGRWAEAPSKDELKRLLACAAEPDFRVASPALMMLKDLPVADRQVPDWLPLLDAPDVAVRRLAIDKVGDRDKPEVVAALLRQLNHGDRPLREHALARLTQLTKGRQALADALLEAASPDEAWTLAKAIVPFFRDFPAALHESLFAQACKHLDSADRLAEPLLFLLRESDPRGLRDRLEEKGVALRKKKDYARALVYFRLLGRDPACAAPVRFELAACGLKMSSKDLSADARAADPTLHQFAALIHSHEAEVSQMLQKAKWLEPEDLFYLGFHFAEKDHQEQKFGGEALKLLIKRSPKSKLAKDAKTKLKREGLD